MKKLTVDGITFETTKEAKAAERELDAIEKIRGRMDVTNPIYARVLYEKLIEKEMLHTKVGDKFLTELQGYFDPEAVKDAVDTGTAQDEIGEAVQESAEPVAQKKEEPEIPYLDEAAQEEKAPDETVLEEYAQEEYSQETGFLTDRKEHGKVGSDTERLEGILNGAIFDEKDLIPFTETTGETDTTGQDTVYEEELSEEYFGATGLDALVEEYDEADSDGAKKGVAREKKPEEEIGEFENADETGLDTFMKEHGLADIPEPEKGAEQQDEEETDAAELDALMKEYGITEAAEPKAVDAEEQQPEEEEEISAEELDTLVGEYTEAAAGVSNAEADKVASNAEDAAESPLRLNIERKEESGRQDEGGFHLDLDDADLYDDDPDDDALLAEARALKKELHQEDLSEIFSEHEDQQEKKHFPLYGLLIVSLILNVVLIASMAIMVQVFKNSDNRNILNYERILEQEYQTATPSDAE